MKLYSVFKHLFFRALVKSVTCLICLKKSKTYRAACFFFLFLVFLLFFNFASLALWVFENKKSFALGFLNAFLNAFLILSASCAIVFLICFFYHVFDEIFNELRELREQNQKIEKRVKNILKNMLGGEKHGFWSASFRIVPRNSVCERAARRNKTSNGGRGA